MSVNRLVVEAEPAAVFAILMDARAYSRWVVGARRIRGVDPEWPAVGARFHHTVGAPVANIDDTSKLLEVERDRRVVLEVRFRPVGVGIVGIDLEPLREGRATRVVMTERPTRGPIREWWSRPLDRITHARNWVALRRLGRLARRGSIVHHA